MASTGLDFDYTTTDLDEALYARSSPSPSSAAYHESQDRDEQEAPGSTSQDVEGSELAADNSMQAKEEDEQDHDPQRRWSELKTKAGKERKRLPLACIVCRRKKIRCSGEKPACKHCARSRIPCVYKVTPRKAAPRTDYMAMLDKRLKRMEDRVIKIIPKDEHRDMAAIGRAVVKPTAPGQSSRGSRSIHKKRSANEAFTGELDAWAQADPAPSRFFGQPQGMEENSLLVEGTEQLPPMELQEHLSEVFFDCVYGQSYLLLHKPSFMRRLKTRSVPPILILAICAVSARFSTHPQVNSEPAFLRGQDWANSAADIALKRYDEPNITVLTVFLILGLHEFGACHGGRSWSFGGMALRMAYALQLHRELDHDPSGSGSRAPQLSCTDREIRRRTMWSCLLMDRYNSSGSERPPMGNDKFMQIQLPIKESHFQMEIPGPTEDLNGSVPNPVPEDVGELSNAKENMGVSAYIIKGIILWGRIVDYLNLGGKTRDPHPLWSPDSIYTKLKRQLEEFSAALPNHLAFTLENLRNHAAEKTANQFLFLHIIIHQNILFLNRFAIPLSPGGRPPNDIPRNFLSDAGRAAVEAAGYISMLINQASGYLLTVPFAGYCAYAASTVHIWGIFSKNTQLEAKSKEDLRHAYSYLNKMKRYWGMFHYMVESAKERYRLFADAALRGSKSDPEANDTPMFQYGDWFDKYPHGVSKLHWEDPSTEVKKQEGGDAVMGQQSDLQSVEDFFASLVPPSSAELSRKEPRKAETQRYGAGPTISSSSHGRSGAPVPFSQPTQPQQHQPPKPHGVVDLAMNQSQPLMAANSAPPEFSDFTNSNIFPTPVQMPFDSSTPNYSFNPEQLPQLDRQLVYDAFHGINPPPPAPDAALPMDPSGNGPSTGSQGATNMSSVNNQSLYMPPDMPGQQNWNGDFLQANAWFLPFNLDPLGEGLDMSGTPQPGARPVDAPPPMSDNQFEPGSATTLLDGFNMGLGLNDMVSAGDGPPSQDLNGQQKR